MNEELFKSILDNDLDEYFLEKIKSGANNKDNAKDELYKYISEKIEAGANNKDITDVISLRPGYGKSQYIISTMSKAIQENKGLLIVTDSIKRLENIAGGNSTDYNIKDYIKRNLDKITLITAANVKEQVINASYTPIVCITTQRYFRMTPSQINNFIRNNKYHIDTILIDEQPEIINTKRIGIKELTRIDEAINKALTNLIEQNDKTNFISYFNILNKSFRKVFQNTENKINGNNTTIDFFYDNHIEKTGTELLKLANKYKSELNNYNNEVFEQIQSLARIAIDGSMVISQKIKNKNDSERYDNYFSFVNDYRKWFTETEGKIIVFDGTADINPLYDTDYFNIIDCSQYEKPLDKLIINIIDVPASKRKLQTDKPYKNAIIQYLRSEPITPQAIFTYKNIKNDFSVITNRLEHFGNIKGSNEFRELTNITQIGLNRYPDHIYTFLSGYNYLSNNNNIPYFKITNSSIELFEEHGINISDSYSCKVTKIINTDYLIRFKNRLLLADIIQNIFRSGIRNTDNQKQISYNLYFSYKSDNKESKSNNNLVQMIQKYFTDRGSKVVLHDTPTFLKTYKIKNRTSENMTRGQAILYWYEHQLKNRILTRKEILKEINEYTGVNISSPALESIKQRNSTIKKIFLKMKIDRNTYKT